jgi:hypothetical protein
MLNNPQGRARYSQFKAVDLTWSGCSASFFDFRRLTTIHSISPALIRSPSQGFSWAPNLRVVRPCRSIRISHIATADNNHVTHRPTSTTSLKSERPFCRRSRRERDADINRNSVFVVAALTPKIVKLQKAFWAVPVQIFRLHSHHHS